MQENQKNKMITVLVNCKTCNKTKSVNVQEKDFDDWNAGALIQKVMPYLNAAERELLISGICNPCFERMFGDDER